MIPATATASEWDDATTPGRLLLLLHAASIAATSVRRIYGVHWLGVMSGKRMDGQRIYSTHQRALTGRGKIAVFCGLVLWEFSEGRKGCWL